MMLFSNNILITNFERRNDLIKKANRHFLLRKSLQSIEVQITIAKMPKTCWIIHLCHFVVEAIYLVSL